MSKIHHTFKTVLCDERGGEVIEYALILGLIGLARSIMNYMHDNKMLNSGAAAAIEKALKGQQDDLARISKELDSARQRFDDAARAGKLPDDIRLRD